MPKVIHVLRKFEPAEWGGVESHIVGLVPELERLGWTSEVHAPAGPRTDGAPLVEVGARFRSYRARYPWLGLGADARRVLVASGPAATDAVRGGMGVAELRELMPLRLRGLKRRAAKALARHGVLGSIVHSVVRARHWVEVVAHRRRDLRERADFLERIWSDTALEYAIYSTR